MNLKPQPRRTRARRGASRTARRTGRGWLRRRGAQRPGTPLHRRVAARLPSLPRIAAGLGAVVTLAALLALLQGPWLRVVETAHAGAHHTDATQVERMLAEQSGRSLLALDTADLAARLEALPAVSQATVRASLPGRLEATLHEHPPAFVWQTHVRRFVVAGDGTIFGQVTRHGPLPESLAGVPLVHDERFVSRHFDLGESVGEGTVRIARRLVGIDPALMGSASTGMSVRLDDVYGFRLVSGEPAWEAALGTYNTDPSETDAEADARLERQVAAIRTLFAERPEAEIGWVDVRNPGKVYFRAKG